MIATILAVVAVQGAVQERELTFEFVELLKYRAQKRIESVRFAISGVIEASGESIEMRSEGVRRGSAMRSLFDSNLVPRMDLAYNEGKLVGVLPDLGVFFEQQYDLPEEGQDKYEPAVIEPDRMELALSGDRILTSFGADLMPLFIAEGDETRGDLELHWVLHEYRDGEHYVTIRQWFYADSWIQYEVQLNSNGKNSGKVVAHFKVERWEPNVEIADEEFKLDTTGLVKIPTPPEFIPDKK